MRITIEIPDEAFRMIAPKQECFRIAGYVRSVADQAEEDWDHGKVLPKNYAANENVTTLTPATWKIEDYR